MKKTFLAMSAMLFLLLFAGCNGNKPVDDGYDKLERVDLKFGKECFADSCDSPAERTTADCTSTIR